MHVACQNGHKDIASVLLANNANVGAQEKVSDFGFVNDGFVFIVISFLIMYLFEQDQWTPLHLACFNGHKDVASVLLAHNANVGAQNNVRDFGFVNDDFDFIVMSFLIMYLF